LGLGELGFPPEGGLARALLKKADMLNPATVTGPKTNSGRSDFWPRLLKDEQLCDCDDLQKLLVGCEIIAALDGVDLLAA
jgi:hypothetical protein